LRSTNYSKGRAAGPSAAASASGWFRISGVPAALSHWRAAIRRRRTLPSVPRAIGVPRSNDFSYRPRRARPAGAQVQPPPAKGASLRPRRGYPAGAKVQEKAATSSAHDSHEATPASSISRSPVSHSLTRLTPHAPSCTTPPEGVPFALSTITHHHEVTRHTNSRRPHITHRPRQRPSGSTRSSRRTRRRKCCIFRTTRLFSTVPATALATQRREGNNHNPPSHSARGTRPIPYT